MKSLNGKPSSSHPTSTSHNYSELLHQYNDSNSGQPHDVHHKALQATNLRLVNHLRHFLKAKVAVALMKLKNKHGFISIVCPEHLKILANSLVATLLLNKKFYVNH